MTDSTLPERARVVVVGGGVIGCSIAYHLTRAGVRDVVLLERKELTAGTTWHAAGLITSAGMPTETFLWMSRYTADLLPQLTEETGQDTGFRRIGHLHLACTPQRVETVTREAAFAKAHGVPIELVGPEEVARHWPAAKVDDILTAAWVPDEGRANPADVTQAYAKGARMGGAQIVEGVTVTGFVTAGGRVTGVETDHGSIETETVVIAAGMWGRQLGALAGVTVPLQAAEHYYLLTDTVEWAHPDLPVVEDPDRYGYYREEAGGILVGLFEPKAAPWSLDRIPQDLGFAVLPPDWDRMAGFLSDAMDRFPSLHDAGIRQFFCGPESFTPDNGPLLGEAPELRGFFAACGLNSLGILLSGGVGSFMAQWILDGEPPMDVTGIERGPHDAVHDQPRVPRGARRRAAGRAVRRRGVPVLAAVERAATSAGRWCTIGWRMRARTSWCCRATRCRSGSPIAGVSHERPQGWARDQSFEAQANEHRAVREAVGVMDMSFMAKILVQGPGAEALLNRVSVCQRLGADRQDRVHPVADRARRHLDGRHRHAAGGGRLPRRRRRHHPPAHARRGCDRHAEGGPYVAITDISSARTLLTVQGPRSRELLSRLTTADLSNEAFPYMRAKEIEVGNGVALALRVTYLGELGWELHIPTDYACTVFDALFAAGADLGIRNAGLGALNSLRLEKGYRDYGLDIDNSDTLIDVGLDFTVAWDKPGGFIGRDALVKQRDSGVRTSRMVQVLVERSRAAAVRRRAALPRRRARR